MWGKKILSQIRGESYEYNREFIFWFGQKEVMTQVEPFLEHKDPFPNTILLGEPGLGKTHLAQYIAFRRNEYFEEYLAPVNPEQLPPYGIVLVDEVHRQTKPEPLFKVMAQTSPTIIAATTRPEAVDKAFRSRFFLELYLKPYKASAMKELIAMELPNADENSLTVLSTAAAGNPRQAKRLAEVARRLDTTDPHEILQACQITADGLTDRHIDYLRTLDLIGKPTGLSQLATLLYADEMSVKIIERLLLEEDLVDLKSTGRTLTRTGRKYLEELDS